MNPYLLGTVDAARMIGVPPGTVRSWSSRKELTPVARDQRERPLYWFKDVVDLAARMETHRDGETAGATTEWPVADIRDYLSRANDLMATRWDHPEAINRAHLAEIAITGSPLGSPVRNLRSWSRGLTDDQLRRTIIDFEVRVIAELAAGALKTRRRDYWREIYQAA